MTLDTHGITKYTRQGRTENPFSTTQMPQATEAARVAMLAAGWEESPWLESVMPRHDWAQSGSAPTYDAYKYCGDYANGRQHIYAGCACYVVKMPDDALTGAPCDIQAVACNVFGDRWLADGARVLVALSDSPAPIADMGAILALPTATPPLMAVIPNNNGGDSKESVTLAIAGTQPANPRAYLHIYIVLADYLTHREAWVEGSATLDANSIEVVYSRNVAPDGMAKTDGWRTALVMAMAEPADVGGNLTVASVPSKYLKYRYKPVNSVDKWMGLDWGVKQALLGFNGNLFTGGEAEEIPLPGDESANANAAVILVPDRPALAPCAWLDDEGHIQVRKSVAVFACPRDVPNGMSLWIKRSDESFTGLRTKLRILVYNGIPGGEEKDVWTGMANGLVAMREITGVEVIGWIRIPLNPFSATQNLTVMAALSEVAREDVHTGGPDTPESLAGFVVRIGIDPRDAHISERLTPSVAAGGWTPNIPVAIRDGLTPPPPPQFVFNGFRQGDAGAPFLQNDKTATFDNIMTFYASTSGGDGSLHPVSGSDFWSFDPSSPPALILSQSAQMCQVKFFALGVFKLNYEARDASEPTPQQISATLEITATSKFELNGFRVQANESYPEYAEYTTSIGNLTLYMTVSGGLSILANNHAPDLFAITGTGASITGVSIQTSPLGAPRFVVSLKFDATGTKQLNFSIKDSSGINAAEKTLKITVN